MRNRIGIIAVVAVALAVPAIAAGQASDRYDLSWAHFPGGGGRSEGGTYAIQGAIGQPVASTSSAGNYVVSGGFLTGQTARYRLVTPLTASDGVLD